MRLVTGNISSAGDCNAEIFTVGGGLTIDGLLNADIVKINLYWSCKVREIGGSEITVKKSGKLSFLGLKLIVTPGGQNELIANIIEGDSVYLENTTAKVVRGTDVTIGLAVKLNWWNIRIVLNRMKNLRLVLIRKYNYI